MAERSRRVIYAMGYKERDSAGSTMPPGCVAIVGAQPSRRAKMMSSKVAITKEGMLTKAVVTT